MPTRVVFNDGTSIEVPDEVRAFTNEHPPVPGWTFIAQGEGMPELYFNPANVAYIVEVEEGDGMPLVDFG